jgi:hypothetical protein
MRFPLRLASRLALGSGARSKRDPIFHLDLTRNSVSAGGSNLPAAAVVWISGADSLDHADVARLANSLAQGRRYVFLQTNAASLRRRIHEFRPSSRLYLTVRFEGAQAFHDWHNGCEGAFRHAIDAIHCAKLAGFLVCAHLIIHPVADPADLEPLHRSFSKLDLDGFLISAASPLPQLVAMAASARQRLLPRRWARLSQTLDSVLLPAVSGSAPVVGTRGRHDRVTSDSAPTNCEEGAQA